MLIDTSLNFLSIEIPFGFHIKYLLIIMSTSDSAGTSGAQVLTPKGATDPCRRYVSLGVRGCASQ